MTMTKTNWQAIARRERIAKRHAQAPQERIERRLLWPRMFALLEAIKYEERAAINALRAAAYRIEQVQRLT